MTPTIHAVLVSTAATDEHQGMLLPLAAVLSMVHLEGDVPPTGGDYIDVAFTVPPGTQEIHIVHTDGSSFVILDWGVWGPDGFRGWGGGNTEDAIIGVDQSSRSYLPGPITPGTWYVNVGKAKLDGTTGRYSIDVTCHDVQSLPVQPKAAFTPHVLATERRWYKGDFHVHSVESGDATATFAQISQLASMRGLDFINMSDHNTSSHLALIAAAQPSFGNVLVLRGAEMTTYAGHGNAVGLPTYVDHRIGHNGRTIEAVLADIAAQNALFIVNHPSLDLGENCIGCAWDHPTTPWDKVAAMELITGPWEVTELLFTPRAIEMWDGLLDQGHRIAAVGGSDDHRAGTGTGLNDSPIGSPTTLVLADELSEAALIDGIRRGRTILQLKGPNDPFVEMKIGNAELGDDVEGVEVAKVAVRVQGGSGNFLQLVRDGKKHASVEVTSDDFTHTFEDEPGAADRRYRTELTDPGGKRVVVTSHIYVHGIAASGCGCRSSGGAAGLLPVLLVLLRRRRR